MNRRSVLTAAGCVAVAAALWVAALSVGIDAFDRCNALPYHWYNHVISELAFPYASDRTWVVNLALVICGFLLGPALAVSSRVVGDLRFPRASRWFGRLMIAGICAIGLLGLWYDAFPAPFDGLRFLWIHLAVADLFFCGWEGLIILQAFNGGRGDSRLRWLAGVCSIMVPLLLFSGTVGAGRMEKGIRSDLVDSTIRGVLSQPKSGAVLSPWLDRHRPAIWWQAVFEWGTGGAVFVWCGSSVILALRKNNGSRTHSQFGDGSDLGQAPSGE